MIGRRRRRVGDVLLGGTFAILSCVVNVSSSSILALAKHLVQPITLLVSCPTRDQPERERDGTFGVYWTTGSVYRLIGVGTSPCVRKKGRRFRGWALFGHVWSGR